ncbi:FAD-dependent oxidoreductase [Dyella silvae]|uniref:FAD-dependent oxidoreductase n=1 Tax=Dyella silvae TaxID=2994424 RepID=UPI0022650942|nr:NAD(P)/FAD-dependent oxidoreductase [Dyella silvae]
MQGRLRIAIVGYGVAGQAAGLFLSAAGHELTIFEQADTPGPVGAGFLLQPTGLSVLAQLGLHEQALARGQRIERLFGCNVAGRSVMDMRYADHAPGCFGLGMARGGLFTLLHRAYDGHGAIRTGTRIERVSADGKYLSDAAGGEHGPFDLIVASDGAHSILRRQPGVTEREVLYPWGAMWCLLPAGAWPHAHVLHQRYAGTREMIGLLPVGRRDDSNDRWLTFYYSLPGEQVDAFNDAALTRLRERVATIWPDALPLLADIRSAVQLHRARYRDVVLRRPVHGNVVFIGDAAHAMSPQLGQGVNMALLDAQALADALAAHDTLTAALDAYSRERRRHVRIYQRLSRWLTPLFQSDRSSLAWMRDRCFGPLGRMPVARGQMLRILTGTKRTWW